MLNKIKKGKILARYFISGSIGAAVHITLLYFFTEILNIYYLISTSLGFIAAFFVSFYLQKFWTFKNRDRRKYRQMIIYFAVAIFNLVLNGLGMYLIVERFKILPVFAQFIMSALIAISSFIIYRYIIFNNNKVRKTGDSIKILIATGIFPPAIGGPATYAKNLSSELKKIGCQVEIISYGPNEGKIEEGVRFVSNKRNILSRYLKYFYYSFEMSGRADIVYILDLMSAGLPATVAARLRGRVVVFRTGGDFLWEKASQKGWTELPLVDYYQQEKNLREKLLLSLERFILEKIDLVMFSTKLQAEIYAKYYSLPDRKIIITSNTLTYPKKIDKQPGFENRFIFAGRLIKLKNISRLIRAFGSVNDKTNRLLIYGDGPEEDNLKSMIKSLRLENRVELKGVAGQSELLSAINSCRFFILPSLTDISPNLALECLSLGKPIILTKHTGLDKEIVKRLITIDPMSEKDIKEKIVYLLDDSNLAEYKTIIENFKFRERSWGDLAREHYNIFKKLLDE